jgi:DNA-binding XRE family transcriptional regulator
VTTLALPLEGLPARVRPPAAAPTTEARISRRLVGERLKAARENMARLHPDAGWESRLGAAKNLGVNVRSLRSWERGRWLPTLGACALLCRAYGVSLEWVVWGATGQSSRTR